VVFLILLTLFSLGIGFCFGYFVNYGYYHPAEFGHDNIYDTIRVLFLEIVAPVILIKASSNTRMLRQFNLNTLRNYPLTNASIFLFDVNIGIFDFTSLYLTEFLFGLIAGAGGFLISVYTFLLFLCFIISLVYFSHMLGELISSIIKLLGVLPKIRTTIISLASIVLLYFVSLKKLDWKVLLFSNPLSWNVSAIFSLTIFNESHWLYNVILLNILFAFICLFLTISIKIVHANLFASHIIQIVPQVKKKKIKLFDIVSLFPSKLQSFLRKDIKYILRSSRGKGAIIMELLFLVFVCYMHFTSKKSFNNFYLVGGFVIIYPVIVWDFFLSNCWGLERSGFGFYLYSNINYNYLIISKNLSYLIVKLPVILFISITVGIIFSFKYFPVMILLYIILFLISLSISSIVSTKIPLPVEFKQSSLSRAQKQGISPLGLAGMMLCLILPAATLFMLYKIGGGILYYSIMAAITVLLFIIYKKMFKYSVSLLIEQKESIYKKLIKI
jgi:hypothetical protein